MGFGGAGKLLATVYLVFKGHKRLFAGLVVSGFPNAHFHPGTTSNSSDLCVVCHMLRVKRKALERLCFVDTFSLLHLCLFVNYIF